MTPINKSKSVCIGYPGDISIGSGGTSRVIALANGLANAGYEIHLVIPKPTKKLPDKLDSFELHQVPIPDKGISTQLLRGIFIADRAKRVAKNNNAVLQLEHSSLAGLSTIFGSSDFILDMHDLAFESPLYTELPVSGIISRAMYGLESRAINRAIAIIVVSKRMKEKLVDEFSVSEDDIIVVPNGYNSDVVSNIENTDNVDPSLITFLGTLHAKVDTGKLIQIARQQPDSTLQIIGGGPQLKKLKKRSSQLGIDNIHYHGPLPYQEALTLTAQSAVTVAPYLMNESTMVSSPVKLLDYAALGKPIVVDNVAELCETFKSNNAALVTPPEDSEAFLNNVEMALSDSSLRNRLSINAQNLADEFSWDSQSNKVVELYNNVS